jgi:hypothetical protein
MLAPKSLEWRDASNCRNCGTVANRLSSHSRCSQFHKVTFMDRPLRTLTSGPFHFLSVIDARLLKGHKLPELKNELIRRFGCPVHLLNREQALAVVLTRSPIHFSGKKVEQFDRIQAIGRAIPCAIEHSQSVLVFVPDSSYYTEIHVYAADVPFFHNPISMQSEDHIKDWSCLEVILSLGKNQPSRAVDLLCGIAENWFTEGKRSGYCGEYLDPRCWRVNTADDVIRIDVSFFGPIVYSALELFLRLRTNVPNSISSLEILFKERRQKDG